MKDYTNQQTYRRKEELNVRGGPVLKTKRKESWVTSRTIFVVRELFIYNWLNKKFLILYCKILDKIRLGISYIHFVYTYMYVYKCVYMCTRAYMCTCVRIHTYILWLFYLSPSLLFFLPFLFLSFFTWDFCHWWLPICHWVRLTPKLDRHLCSERRELDTLKKA